MSHYSLILQVFLGVLLPLTAAGQLLDELFDAANKNDLPRLSRLLDRGMDPSSTDKNGYTLLMYAARDGNAQVVRALLERKAQVDARNPHDETAVMLAAFNGHAPTVKLLQAHGAQLDKDGWAAAPLRRVQWQH